MLHLAFVAAASWQSPLLRPTQQPAVRPAQQPRVVQMAAQEKVSFGQRIKNINEGNKMKATKKAQSGLLSKVE